MQVLVHETTCHVYTVETSASQWLVQRDLSPPLGGTHSQEGQTQ